MLGSKHHVCESHTVLHMYTPESTPSALQQCAAPSYTLPRKPHNLIFIHISNYMYVFFYIYICLCVCVCVSCPPSLKPTFLVPALESKPRRLFSISALTPPTSVRSGYASFPCSLLLFQPTPTFRSFTLPSQVLVNLLVFLMLCLLFLLCFLIFVVVFLVIDIIWWK